MRIHTHRRPRTRMTALAYALRTLEVIDTPRSLAIALLLKYGEHRQAVELKDIDPALYDDAPQFFLDYQATKLVSKLPGLKTGIDTEAVAYQKFLKAEETCALTNARFRDFGSDPSQDRVVGPILYRAARKIADVLGSVPSLDAMQFSFGPGAAYGVRGETSAYHKVQSDLECTYAFADCLPEFLGEFSGWIREDSVSVKLIPGSQLTFVPKDATTDRAICIEPLLNGLHQKGVGSYIKRRLAKHGIDLKDQGNNQRLAASAQKADLATVDFSSASDTIAYGLVLHLLPCEWFEMLELSRCPRYEYHGQWRSFQKFSSMGNAYTFELETLIFYSIAFACMEHLGIEPKTGVNLSVYGDDVIIPQAAFPLFEEVSNYCGFTVNLKKSFVSGRFFESCGHDYFDGFFVRPILLTKQFKSLTDVYYATNCVVRIAERLTALQQATTHFDYHGALARLRHHHRWCVGTIPVNERLTGPDGFGDGHLIFPLDVSLTLHRADERFEQWEGWWFRSVVTTSVRTNVDGVPNGYALYGTRLGALPQAHLGWEPESSHNGNWFVSRSKTRSKVKLLFCPSEWRDLSSLFWDGYFTDDRRHETSERQAPPLGSGRSANLIS